MNLERDNSVTREFQSVFSQCNFTWEVRYIGYNIYCGFTEAEGKILFSLFYGASHWWTMHLGTSY